MKGVLTRQYRTRSSLRDAAWIFGFALGLSFLGVAVAHSSVTHAQNHGMKANMTQDATANGNTKGVDHEISIDNFSFAPMDVTIPVGSQVTWVNKDDVPHTVVSVDHQFKSKALDTDEKFSFTFPNPGIYEYFCSVHPKMVGKIVVK